MDDLRDDGDEEGTGTGAGRRCKRRREHEDGVSPPKRGPAARPESAVARRKRAEEVDAYYSDRNGYGKPSALLLFKLCHALQHDDNFHIW